MEYHKFYLLFAILSVADCITVDNNSKHDGDGKPKNPIIDFLEGPLKAFRGGKPDESIAFFDPQILKAPLNSSGISWFNKPANLGAAAASTLTDWIRRNSASQTTTTTTSTTTTPEPQIFIDFSKDYEPEQTKTERKKRKKKKKKVKKVTKKKKTSKRRINFDEDDDEEFAYDEFVRPLPPPVPKKRRRFQYYNDLGDDYFFDEPPVFNPHRNYYFHDENDYYVDDYDPISFWRPVYEAPLKRHSSARNRNRRRRPNRPHQNTYIMEDQLLPNDDFVQPFSDLPEETRPVKHGQNNRRKPQQQTELSDPQYSLVIPVQAAFVQSLQNQIQSQRPHRKPHRPSNNYQDSLGYQTAVAFVPVPVDRLGAMQGSSFDSPSSGQKLISLPGMQIIAHHSHTIQTQPSQSYVLKSQSDKNTEENDHEHEEQVPTVKPTKKSQKGQEYNDHNMSKQKPTKASQRPTTLAEQPPKPIRIPYGLSLNENNKKDKILVSKKKTSTVNKDKFETDPNRPDFDELRREDDSEDQEISDEKDTYIIVGDDRHTALPKSVEAKSQYYVEPEYYPYLGSDSLFTVSNKGNFFLKSMRRRRTMEKQKGNPEIKDEQISEGEIDDTIDEHQGTELENQDDKETNTSSGDENNDTANDEIDIDDDEASKAAINDDESEEPTHEEEEDESKTEQYDEKTEEGNEEEAVTEQSSNTSDGLVKTDEKIAVEEESTDETELKDENRMPFKNPANSVSAILRQTIKAEHPQKQIIRSEIVHEKPNGHFIVKTDRTGGKSDLTIEGSKQSQQQRINPKFQPII